jgi:hypothetical protein
MFLACQQSKVTIKLIFYYTVIWKNAVETDKIAVVTYNSTALFNLTPLPSIYFREIRGQLEFQLEHNKHRVGSFVPLYIKFFLWPDEK